MTNDLSKYWGYLNENIKETEILELRAIQNQSGAKDRIFTRQEKEYKDFCNKWTGREHIFASINPHTVLETGKVSKVQWFVLDIDNPGGNDLETLKSFQPRFIVFSGRGYHAYFNISSASVFVRDDVRLRNSAAIAKIGAKIQGKCDPAVADPERVMRVPGTMNMRNGAMATIVYEGEQNKKFINWYYNLEVTKKENNIKVNPVGWISEALLNMQMGNIDTTLVKVLGRLRNDGYTEKDAQILLQPYADKAGATPGHLEEKVKHVWESYKAKISYASKSTGISFSDLSILENVQETKWLVQDILPEASLTYICGDPKSRKSWLAFYIGLCVALGRDVFKFKTQQAPVLYIQLEDGLARVGVRYSKLTLGLKEKPLPEFFKLYVGSELKFNQEQTWGTILEFCSTFKPRLIVVDTLAKSHTSLENDATEMSVVLDRFCKLRDTCQATILIVHHLKKPGQGDRNKRYMAGSRVIEASAESMLFVESDTKKQQSDVAVISKSIEEFGFSYKVVDDVVESKPCIRLMEV